MSFLLRSLGAMVLALIVTLAIGNFIQRDRESELRSRDCWAVTVTALVYTVYIYFWLL